MGNYRQVVVDHPESLWQLGKLLIWVRPGSWKWSDVELFLTPRNRLKKKVKSTQIEGKNIEQGKGEFMKISKEHVWHDQTPNYRDVPIRSPQRFRLQQCSGDISRHTNEWNHTPGVEGVGRGVVTVNKRKQTGMGENDIWTRNVEKGERKIIKETWSKTFSKKEN